MLGWERIISTMLGPGESPHCSLPHCVLLASGLESTGEYSTLYSTTRVPYRVLESTVECWVVQRGN